MPSKFIKISSENNSRTVEAGPVGALLEKVGLRSKSPVIILEELDKAVAENRLAPGIRDTISKLLDSDLASSARARAQVVKDLQGKDAADKAGEALRNLGFSEQKILGKNSPIAKGSRFVGNKALGYNEQDLVKWLRDTKLQGKFITDASGVPINTPGTISMEKYIKNPEAFEIDYAVKENLPKLQELMNWKEKKILAENAAKWLSPAAKLGLGIGAVQLGSDAWQYGKTKLKDLEKFLSGGVDAETKKFKYPFPEIMQGSKSKTDPADEFVTYKNNPGDDRASKGDFMYLNPQKDISTDSNSGISLTPSFNFSSTLDKFIKIAKDDTQDNSGENKTDIDFKENIQSDATKMPSPDEILEAFEKVFTLQDPKEIENILQQVQPYVELAKKYTE